MEKNNKDPQNTEIKNEHVSTSMTLDDEQRIKVLSPSMLVAKRFFRNRLAIIGLVIIIAMFLFSFVGGLIGPYGETQIFYREEPMLKNYASATINTNFYYSIADGKNFPGSAQAAMVLASTKGEGSFSSGDVNYILNLEGENFYRVQELVPVATAIGAKGIFSVIPVDGFTGKLDDAFKAAFADAVKAGTPIFKYGDNTYNYTFAMKQYSISEGQDIAIASKKIFDMYDKDAVASYTFKYEAEKAYNEKASAFEADGVKFDIKQDEDSATIFRNVDGKSSEYARISDLIVTSSSPDVFLSIDFKDQVSQVIKDGVTSFEFPDANGTTVTYDMDRKDFQYLVRTETSTRMMDSYASPSLAHPLGTDGAGMDLLTRLMYGGRVSLMIGFVVVIIETVLGIIMGGISGYFSGWIDTIIMRIVDIFNCIPSLPLYIIFGTVMSSMDVPPNVRIYYMMLILGILSWPSIARVVRGQILSLREQEFMTATEATGISVYRRIFRHLVPNVIPQIIVYATMGLGSVILMEATLSFLGLGVKFPYASWGNIVNAVNDSFVLTNYWFVWIPAGFLILITVLGFNFVGDGLRDAFDPKMKR